MKIINIFRYIIPIILFITISGCNDPVTDFGYDGSIEGRVLDQSGNIVSGDITSSDFSVIAHGERDDIPMELRVGGDGTFLNTKLFPQSYRVWIEGPVISSEEFTVDLSEESHITHEFTVTPFLTIPPPETTGSATSTEVTVSYNITGNQGHEAELREVYVSTVAYPTHSTGSGVGWHTQTVSMDEDQGTVTISGLESDTKYHIRIGARAEGASSRNFSDQITVTTSP